MAAADCAPLPIALLRLVILADELLTFGHGHGLGIPQRERVDRAGGPAPAVRAMAVAGADGVTRHDEPDRTTETLPLERLLVLTHDTPSSCSVGTVDLRTLQVGSNKYVAHSLTRVGPSRERHE